MPRIACAGRAAFAAAWVAAALAAPIAAGGTKTGLRSTVFDGMPIGNLPRLQFTRPYATIDPTGAPAAVNEPRYAEARTAAPFHEWSVASTNQYSVLSAWSGFDRDDSTPVLALINSFTSRLDFWIGAPITAPPSFVLSLSRTGGGATVRDALQGDALQRPNHAYEPKAGTVLPGAIVFLCERHYDVNENPASRDWQPEGVSVLVYQSLAGGGWQWSIVYDGPRLNGDATALGWNRVRAASMLSYYPRQLLAPLTSAFIPFTDYINDGTRADPKKGGQLFIFEATRPDAQSDWSFGPVVLVAEQVQSETHFHSAAWTPNGVLLSVGDSVPNNVVRLYTCSDWDDYANLANWTEHDGFHGAAGARGVASFANQFWGCIPGRDLNTVIVGADLLSGALHEITIPADPADGATFRRLYGHDNGTAPTSGLDYHIAEWIHRPAPERSTRVIARSFFQGSTLGHRSSRIVMSEDAEHFAPVARMPVVNKSALALLYGDDIVAPNLTTLPGPAGIYHMPVPTMTPPRRALLVGGGGTNHLMVGAGTGALIDPAPTTGTTRTLVQASGQSGLHPITGAPLEAPTFAPVYRLTRLPGAPGTIVLDVPIAGPATTIAPGTAIVPMWVNMLGAEGITLIAELTDGVVTRQQEFRIVERDAWTHCLMSVSTAGFANPYVPRLRLRIANQETDRIPCDFMLAIDGLAVNEAPGYPIAPINGGVNDGTAYGHEQVVQPLPALGTEFTIEMELRLPVSGIDSTQFLLFSSLPIATIYSGPGEYVQLDSLPATSTLQARVYSGGALAGVVNVPRFFVRRHDHAWIRLAFSPGNLNAFAVSGGATQDGIAVGTGPLSLGGAPTEIRFGSADFASVFPMEIVSITVDPNQALGGEIVDCNLNGVPDAQEIALNPGVDADRNGVLDSCEVDADLNGDGVVGFADILVLLGAWGVCPPPPSACPADIDGSGDVGFSDILAVLANWTT